jgi:hypothetical protein
MFEQMKEKNPNQYIILTLVRRIKVKCICAWKKNQGKPSAADLYYKNGKKVLCMGE